MTLEEVREQITWEKIYEIWTRLLDVNSIDLSVKEYKIEKPKKSLTKIYHFIWAKKDDVEKIVDEANKIGLLQYAYFYLRDVSKGEDTTVEALLDERNTLETISGIFLTGWCRGLVMYDSFNNGFFYTIIDEIQYLSESLVIKKLEYTWHYKSKKLLPKHIVLDDEHFKNLDLQNRDIDYWLEELIKIFFNETNKILNEYCICILKNY